MIDLEQARFTPAPHLGAGGVAVDLDLLGLAPGGALAWKRLVGHPVSLDVQGHKMSGHVAGAGVLSIQSGRVQLRVTLHVLREVTICPTA